jgi:hypothetical protein
VEQKKRRMGVEQRVEVEVKPSDQTQEIKSLLTVMVDERPRPRLSEPGSRPVPTVTQPRTAGTGDILSLRCEGRRAPQRRLQRNQPWRGRGRRRAKRRDQIGASAYKKQLV